MNGGRECAAMNDFVREELKLLDTDCVWFKRDGT